uniref:DnaJ homolog subfamily C member 3 n=1 Tax=Prolemur simus TaxID=1328070 RepID=A0A8C9DND0_PROSS
MVAPGSVTSRLGSVFPFLLVLVDLQYEGAECGVNADVEKHLELGKKLLAAGQLADALSQFHAAVGFARITGLSHRAWPEMCFLISLLSCGARGEEGELRLKRCQERGILVLLFLKVCVWDAELRELRAECFIKEGEPRKAISDLKAASKLKNDNTEAFYKISTLYYQLGDHELSLSEVRECLKLDQDHKRCFAHYKQVKKLNKLIESAEELIRDGRYTDATSKYESVMKTEPNIAEYTIRSKERICHCFSKDEKPVEAIRICSEVLQLEPDNVNALKDRAEAYLVEEMYDEAIQDYETAQEHNENDQQIREGLEKAQRLLKQSQKRDYYKILGVKRNAKKQEIIKAYRKLAMQWHPDNFQNEEEKKKAEKKFIDIAAAKEVLSDPEMRKKFDDGEDPLDAESQQGGGSNPFHRSWNSWQGFNPFSSGGPFRFKFHFN